MHFGHESRAITMLFLNEIIPLAIPYRLFIIKMLTILGHKSRAITLLFLNEIIPFTIPYHSSPIPMFMLSLKKIGKKVLKLEHGNQAQNILTYTKGHNSVVSERN